jgi:RNA polymerase subunit RPABC4/transcription elongation factor Spt4
MYLVSWPGGSWEATLKGAGAVVVVYIAALWLTTIFWTYRDIRQRSRDPIVQFVAVLLVLLFFLPGLWVYQILRPRYTLSELYERSLEEEALLQELEDQKVCSTCKRRVRDDFLICPSCRTQLKELCQSCSRPLSYAWVACPYCGVEKPPRAPAVPRPMRAAAGAGQPPPARTAQVRAAPAAAQPPQTFGSRPARLGTDEPPMIDATAD